MIYHQEDKINKKLNNDYIWIKVERFEMVLRSWNQEDMTQEASEC